MALRLANAAARAEDYREATRLKDHLPPQQRRLVEDILLLREERDRYRASNAILRARLAVDLPGPEVRPVRMAGEDSTLVIASDLDEALTEGARR